jgi:hypothetical protein
MSYNSDSPANSVAEEIRENFRALKEDKIVAANTAVTADSATTATYATSAGSVPWSGITDAPDIANAADYVITQSLGLNGYTKWASGKIEQWGHITDVVGNDSYLTFPIEFPTACFSIVATLNMDATGNDYVYETKIRSLSNTQARLFINGSGCYWYAIGY